MFKQGINLQQQKFYINLKLDPIKTQALNLQQQKFYINLKPSFFDIEAYDLQQQKFYINLKPLMKSNAVISTTVEILY